MQEGVHTQKRNQRHQKNQRLGQLTNQKKEDCRADKKPEHWILQRIGEDTPDPMSRRFDNDIGSIEFSTRQPLPGVQAYRTTQETLETVSGK